jgi:protein-tyrosine phosphatase
MFETIETRHGSAEGFLRDEIKLDDSTLAAIRERLLV